jgi:hypothetical protein
MRGRENGRCRYKITWRCMTGKLDDVGIRREREREREREMRKAKL